MINKIELKNFQSHKDTVIDFSEGINVLCGESDNGKSAVIRAIRWVYENRPVGIDKLNSFWNKNLKEEMSVKITLSDGKWVKRIRDKNSNGYHYFDGSKEVKLDAIGTDVPQIIIDILNMSDVNFQFQLDSPYLLSMSSSEASKYLNQIIHLDSIDSVLSQAEHNRRTLNSEDKVVSSDVDSYTKKIHQLDWLDEANEIQKRIDKYESLIEDNDSRTNSLSQQINSVEKLKTEYVDLSEQTELVEAIESVEIPDYSIIEKQVNLYSQFESQIVDLSEQTELVKAIESVEIPDYSQFESQIENYQQYLSDIENYEKSIIDLKKQLPKVCPLCGSNIGENHVC